MKPLSYFASHRKALVYLVGGQVGWFACVLGAARGMAWLGVLVALLLLLLHVVAAKRSLQEAKLIAAVAALGATWESVLVVLGILGYPHDAMQVYRAPLWIVALWALFAAQINVAYRWLKVRPGVSALFGAVAGPLSFRAGAALDAVRILQGGRTFIVLAIGWGLLLPAVVMLSRRWDGVGDSKTHS